jgi:hypothetical protein
LDNTICSACCGSKRGTQLACPDGCPHFPFCAEGYDAWLRVDGQVMPKALQHVRDACGKSHFQEIVESMRWGDGGKYGTGDDNTAILAALHYALYVERDNGGRTLAERWKSGGWKGLTNDECVMLDHRMHSRVTIVEIQKVRDTQSMDCTDLLDPQRGVFKLVDRNLASHCVRFTRAWTWLTHYPHFSKPEFSGMEIPDHVFEEFMDAMWKAYRRDAPSHPDVPVKDYLSKHSGTFLTLLSELMLLKRTAMLENMDLHWCRAFYRIAGDVGKVLNILDRYPDFQLEEGDPDQKAMEGGRCYQWLRRGESKALEKEMPVAFRHDGEGMGVGVIGKIVVRQDGMVLEVLSKQKFVFAKKWIKKYFKKDVILQREIIEDTAKKYAAKINSEEDLENDPTTLAPAPNENAIPIEAERELMQNFYRDFYRKFIEGEVPALYNRSPRQAAGDPAMRPKLIALMKNHLKNMARLNREKGMNISIDWVLDELRLAELK